MLRTLEKTDVSAQERL